MSRGLPNFLLNGYRNCLLGVKWPKRDSDHTFRVLPKLRMSRAVLLLPIYAFMAWTGMTFTLNFGQTYSLSPWLQASAAMLVRSAFFWGVTQRRMVNLYRRFGTTYRSHLQRSGSPVKQKASWCVEARVCDTPCRQQTKGPCSRRQVRCPEVPLWQSPRLARVCDTPCRQQTKGPCSRRQVRCPEVPLWQLPRLARVCDTSCRQQTKGPCSRRQVRCPEVPLWQLHRLARVCDTSCRQRTKGPFSWRHVRYPEVSLWQSPGSWVGLYRNTHPISSSLSLEVFMHRWWGRRNPDVAKSSAVFSV
jgi:hypothetical protein